MMDKLQKLIEQYNIPVVNIYNTLDLDHINNLEGQEGVVVRFTDGHCVKIKGSWYVDLHKTKEAISSERYVIKMIFSNMVDDLLPKLMEEDKTKLLDYQTRVLEKFSNYIKQAEKYAEIELQLDRKTFALNRAELYSNDIRTFIFKKYDNPSLSAAEHLTKCILDKCGSNKNLESIRHVYSYLEWNYNNA